MILHILVKNAGPNIRSPSLVQSHIRRGLQPPTCLRQVLIPTFSALFQRFHRRKVAAPQVLPHQEPFTALRNPYLISQNPTLLV